MRGSRFSAKPFTSLPEGLVRTTVDNVEHIFRAYNGITPTMTMEHFPPIFYSNNTKAEKNQDKNVKQQKVTQPLILLRELFKTRSTIKNIAIAQLCFGTIFFVILSFKYLCTINENKKWFIITLQLWHICCFVKAASCLTFTASFPHPIPLPPLLSFRRVTSGKIYHNLLLRLYRSLFSKIMGRNFLPCSVVSWSYQRHLDQHHVHQQIPHHYLLHRHQN